MTIESPCPALARTHLTFSQRTGSPMRRARRPHHHSCLRVNLVSPLRKPAIFLRFALRKTQVKRRFALRGRNPVARLGYYERDERAARLAPSLQTVLQSVKIRRR